MSDYEKWEDRIRALERRVHSLEQQVAEGYLNLRAAGFNDGEIRAWRQLTKTDRDFRLAGHDQFQR